jgi:hypothetical protein
LSASQKSVQGIVLCLNRIIFDVTYLISTTSF